jgi:hypothetical protein
MNRDPIITADRRRRQRRRSGRHCQRLSAILDELPIYGRALSDEEIAALANGVQPPAAP